MNTADKRRQVMGAERRSVMAVLTMTACQPEKVAGEIIAARPEQLATVPRIPST